MSVTNGDARKVIHLGMPCTGEMTVGAAHGFHRCTRRKNHHVQLLAVAGSLACMNFNRLWCWTLNAARKGRVDYFAMQHSDVEPQEYWLDPLVDELEARGLDVLGVVAPIKDPRGRTSIAVAHPSGDPWRIRYRLTMDEVHRLPETFTSGDVGGPLLINTGLWVCKFNPDWADKVFFTVNDRIMIDRDGDYVVQAEPEDWFVSRLFHELGLNVGCTRKVELWHRGGVAYGNATPWGNDRFDKEYTDKSFLDDGDDWFPNDAAGWLTADEGRELARLAEGKVVLEVGAYAGRSTICLAQKAVCVGTIDTFDGRGTAQPGNTLPLFRRNLKRYGVGDKVRVYEGESLRVMEWLPPVYDLVFIDGSHDRESVLADAAAASRLLKPNGRLVFHDYGGNDQGVTDAVNELIAGGGELLGRCGTLAIVRPPKSSAAKAPVEELSNA